MKRDLELCYKKIEFLSGIHIEKRSLSDIEELEKNCLNILAKISTIKKEKIIEEYENKQIEKRSSFEHYHHNYLLDQKKKVDFDVVKTREFSVGIGHGVPSVGFAPIGIDELKQETSEPVQDFEKRREHQRKGILRIPENERRNLLKDNNVTDMELNEDAKEILAINQNRLASLSSPTNNPLNENERLKYKKNFDLIKEKYPHSET